MMQLSQCTWTFPELLKRPAFLRRSIDSISSRSRSSSKYPSFMASASTVSAPNTEAEQTHNPPQPLQVIHLWLLPFLKMFWWVCFNFRSCLAISCKSMGFFFSVFHMVCLASIVEVLPRKWSRGTNKR